MVDYEYDLKKTLVLNVQQLEGLKSPYWHGGLQTETMEVYSADITGKNIKTICRQPQHYVSPYDEKYHLSVPIAVGLIAQVGIVHAHVLKGEMEKKTEALMTDFQLKIGKTIDEHSQIIVDMDIIRLITSPPKGQRKKPRTYFEWRFSIGESWWGTTTIVFSV